MKVGNLVIKVLVKDFDYGMNGELNFFIIVGNMLYFSIDNIGVVKIWEFLFIFGGKNFILMVVVSDRGIFLK